MTKATANSRADIYHITQQGTESMGLTIHYALKSRTRSLKKARELVAQLRGRAMDLPFALVDDII
jgi:hypothetical protein